MDATCPEPLFTWDFARLLRKQPAESV